MNLLLISEISEAMVLPAFGPEFEKHMEAKRHPAVRAASGTAWRLLASALQIAGITSFPLVSFMETGKPAFVHSPLHFSLSHSGKIAAALLCDAPCAVDVELVRIEMQNKLFARCMHEHEQALNCDFFECWTKKECLGKLSGKGLPSRPAEMDSLAPEYANLFHMHRFTDSSGQAYQLCALCTNRQEPNLQMNLSLL